MGMDLWIAMGFLAAVSGLAFLAGRRLSLSVYRNQPSLLLESLFFSLLFAFGVVGRLAWADAFPVSAAVCWSNWMPIFLAFTAGLAIEIAALGFVWRKAVGATLILLSIGFLTLPVARPHLYPIAIAEAETWEDGICMAKQRGELWSCGRCNALASKRIVETRTDRL